LRAREPDRRSADSVIARQRYHQGSQQCTVLEGSGLFQEERVELVDGELIRKMGKNRLT